MSNRWYGFRSTKELVDLIIVGYVIEILCYALSWVLIRSSIGVLEEPWRTDGWGDADVGAIIDVCQILHIIAGPTMGCHCLAMFGVIAGCIL